MAVSLQAAATLMQPTKIGINNRSTTLHLKSTQSISKAFGLEHNGAKLTCSLQDIAHRFADSAKIAGFALATSALVVSVCFTLSLFYSSFLFLIALWLSCLGLFFSEAKSCFYFWDELNYAHS